MSNLLTPAGPRYWLSPVGDVDDFNDPIQDVIIDGATVLDGQWALMTPASWAKYGATKSLGIGKGQKYVRQPDGKWLLTEGWL